MPTIDHLGVAVKSIATAKALYEKLGMVPCAEEIVEGEKVRVVMIPTGESRIELLEPTSPDSTIGASVSAACQRPHAARNGTR